MRRAVGGVLARHLEGRRPVPEPPVNDEEHAEDGGEGVEDRSDENGDEEGAPARDEAGRNDPVSKTMKRGSATPKVRSKNKELRLTNKDAASDLNESLLMPEGQQTTASAAVEATTAAKKVKTALNLVSLEAESGAWHQLDGPVYEMYLHE